MAGALRRWIRRLFGRRAARPRAAAPEEASNFPDTQDLLDDVHQASGIEVNESTMDNLPDDVRRHFESAVPRLRE